MEIEIKFHWFPLQLILCQKSAAFVMKKERISITIPKQAHNSKSKIYSAFTCELKRMSERDGAVLWSIQCELKVIYFSWFWNSILIVSRFVSKNIFLPESLWNHNDGTQCCSWIHTYLHCTVCISNHRLHRQKQQRFLADYTEMLSCIDRLSGSFKNSGVERLKLKSSSLKVKLTLKRWDKLSISFERSNKNVCQSK